VLKVEQWRLDHPDFEEFVCPNCKQRARGTPAQIADWIPRHEAYANHSVSEKK